jgi:hypothetical protein
MDQRPDWQLRLSAQVAAIERNIEVRPDQSIAEARTLLEAVARTLCVEMGLPDTAGKPLPKQMHSIISALDLRLHGHPRADDIKQGLEQLFGSLNGAVSAIARLSNIEGLRHGSHYDWPKLERRHAVMLGGFCDTLVAFVIEAASSEQLSDRTHEEETAFEDAVMFNDWVDANHEAVTILEAVFQPSQILYTLDWQQYDSALAGWQPEE